MSTPSPDEIAERAAATAAEGVASATADGQSATAIDPEKQLNVADRLRERQALAAASTGWGGFVRPARAVPPGAGPS